MRSRAQSIALIVAAAALVALPSLTTAGWRSSDRRQLDEEAVVEPCDRDCEIVDEQSDGWDRNQMNGDWHQDRTIRHHHRRVEQVPLGTQPYWGTMRPYWNGFDPPGVIHRQPRTAPLKIHKKR